MYDDHTNIALQFSGGKDSTALLYCARPYLDRITVLFADTGAIFPHVIEHVHETCRKLGAKLVVEHTDVQQWIRDEGIPSDIVPIESMKETAHFVKSNGPYVQSYMKCCAYMIWAPLQGAVKRIGATAVLRGSKASDPRVGVKDGHVEDGITYYSPLWDWDDALVYAYLKSEGVTLPAHYPQINDSLDCWCCTAHLLRGGPEKMNYMAEHYPALLARVRPNLHTLLREISPARKAIAASVYAGENK